LSGLLTLALFAGLITLYFVWGGGGDDDDDEDGGRNGKRNSRDSDDDGSPLSDARRIMDKYK